MPYLDDGLWGLSCHVVDGILVTQPVGAFDGVVHVPSPVIGLHVAEGGVDATLSCYGVRSSGKELGDHRRVEALLHQAECGTKAGTTGADDDRIKGVIGYFVRRQLDKGAERGWVSIFFGAKQNNNNLN